MNVTPSLTLLLIALAGCAAVLAILAVSAWQRRVAMRRAIERDFRNVFAMTSPERKEALIKSWMERRKCSRVEAMRLAVEDRRHAR
jgi:hypothetical protein